jgi:hypothetical protein
VGAGRVREARQLFERMLRIHPPGAGRDEANKGCPFRFRPSRPLEGQRVRRDVTLADRRSSIAHVVTPILTSQFT